tara:strand:+ start:8966 stop:9826 length:861 start_codon:yes stop_codon:yes gene_type:complete
VELSEKAKSKAQQRFFGMVRAAQKGEMENPSKEVLDVADDISVKDAKDFAKTKHKGLPAKVKEEAVFSIGRRANAAMKRDKDKKELKRLLGKAAAMKKQGSNYHPFLHDPKESFEIDKSEHKKVQKQKKMRNLAIKNTNKNEGDVAHKKAGGPKLIGEEPERTAEYKAMQASLHPRGSTSDAKQGESATAHRVGGWRKPYLRDRNAKRNRGFRKYAGARVNEGKLDKIMDTVRKYSKKRKAEKKPEKAMDAGARGRRILQRREYADRISGSTENVPDDIRDHYLHI